MVAARLQILAEGQHVAIVATEIFEHLLDFVALFAETQHQPGLGGNVRVLLLEALEEPKRPRVVGTGPRHAIQARHRFQIVVEHVRRCLGQRRQGALQAAAEVRHQNLDTRIGTALAQPRHAGGKMAGAAVAEIIAIHRRDDQILQPHHGHRFGDVLRLLVVQRLRAPVGDIAEGTAARAQIAHDHEGCRSVAEALGEIRTRGLLADGVQPLLAKQVLDPPHTGPERRLDTDPGRLARQRPLHRNDLDRVARHLVRATLGPRGFARWFDLRHSVSISCTKNGDRSIFLLGK